LAEYDDSATPVRQKWYVWGNYVDEMLMIYSDANSAEYYPCHDHLYSLTAMVSSDGNVVERYEYDAYGRVNILDNNYNELDSSKIGNSYYFTGRRLDILDSGSLKLQYNRNRYYDNYAGRWLTHDPLGYVDSMNLYEYVSSNPINRIDSMGLWGGNIHNSATRRWAIDLDYTNKSAIAIGAADAAVDRGETSFMPDWLPIIGGTQAYHFNRNLSGGTDSRLELYTYHFEEAKKECSWENKNPSTAVIHLGTALHPYQDWVAHGDYGIHDSGTVWTVHNKISPQRDFGNPAHYPDDRTLDAVNGPNGRPVGLAMHWVIINGGVSVRGYAIYERGLKRYNLTKSITKDALGEFKNYVEKDGSCECRRYFLGMVN